MITYLGKILILGLMNALGIWAAMGLFSARSWIALLGLLVGLVVVNVILLNKRAYPLRYLLPGFLFFSLMVLYPIAYNMTIAFTNFGTGHRLTEEQAIAHFEGLHYLPEGGERFTYRAFRDAEGNLTFLLTSQISGDSYLIIGEVLEPIDLEDPRFLYEAGDIIQINGYRRLSRRELMLLLGELQQLSFLRDDRVVRLTSLKEFRVFEQKYRYDREQGVLVDLRTGVVYTPVDGTFTSAAGETLQPGFTARIGLRNFYDMFRDPHIAGPFLRIFGWTFLWAFLSVAMSFVLGLGLAILLNNSYLKMRHFYRSFLILPYAVPAFISILIWAGLFNVDFGVINQMLGVRVPWFHDGFWARVALLLVNLWLGFPYMMIISSGALQSIPEELHEAACVDGASQWQQFVKITLPILLISIAPLLVGSFAFNFNNFNVIYLLTGGGPPIAGARTLAGQSDILISYTFKLAFGGAGAQYGFAAAISLVIFLVIGTISAINFRFTRRLERVGEEL